MFKAWRIGAVFFTVVFGLAAMQCLDILRVGPLAAQTTQPSPGEPLSGNTDNSLRYGSGWMDLAPPVNFSPGERLRIMVGGSAEKVLVRLLPRGGSIPAPTGLVEGVILVPASRVIDVPIPNARPDIVQISVHGGPSAWGISLGPDNGPATVVSITRVR